MRILTSLIERNLGCNNQILQTNYITTFIDASNADVGAFQILNSQYQKLKFYLLIAKY